MNNFLDDLVSIRNEKGLKHALNLLYREVNSDTIAKILPDYLKKLVHKYLTTHKGSNKMESTNLDEEEVIETIPIVLRINFKIISLNSKDSKVYSLYS